MQVVYERCCGLDVHKRTVVACRIVPGADGTPRKEIRTFGTLTSELLALADWLSEAGCTHVAMESTGVFWKPIYNLLEDQFAVLVVNAQHRKAVPRRKTDVQLRHEVAQVAVGIAEAGSNLVFCHPYPTMACGRSNSAVRSPWETVASLNGAALKP
jgi:transposase